MRFPHGEKKKSSLHRERESASRDYMLLARRTTAAALSYFSPSVAQFRASSVSSSSSRKSRRGAAATPPRSRLSRSSSSSSSPSSGKRRVTSSSSSSALAAAATSSSSSEKEAMTTTTTNPRSPRGEDGASFRGSVARETIAYKRYLAVYDRTVEFASPDDDDADGEEEKKKTISIKYDIVGHPRSGFRFVAVLPFHSATKEFTICREYIQSVNASGVTVPTGGHEPEKHGEDIANAAKAEMNEEAKLVGGTLVNLMEKKSENERDRKVGEEEGFIETKWCRNKFVPFLCVDPREVEEGQEGKLDVEEFALETFRVSLKELKRMMYSGEMMLPSIITCQMSLDYLVKSGLISRDEYHESC